MSIFLLHNNLTPGFLSFRPFIDNKIYLLKLYLLYIFIKTITKKCQPCWFTILWQSYGEIFSSMRGKMVSILKLAKKFCAQKSDTHEIKRLTKASICSIIAQTVLCCTCVYPIILDFWNIQHALITHIFLSITWSPSYCRYWVSINLAVKRHIFFSPDIVLLLKCDICRNWDENQYIKGQRHFCQLKD